MASDIHAVGIIAIEALTGIAANSLPRDGNSLEIVWRDRVSVSPKLGDILDKMVSYNYQSRYQNAGEALKAINYVKMPKTIPSLPTTIQQQKFKLNPQILIIIVAILGLICGILAVIKSQQEPEYEYIQPGKDLKFEK